MKQINSVFIYLMTLAIYLCSCSLPSHQDIPDSLTHVLETDVNYSVIWDKEDYWIDRDEQMPKIIGAPDMIVLEGRNSEYQELFIKRIDSTTGNIIWEKSIWTNMPGEIVVHNNMLFRGTYGAAIAQAFDLNTGELIWDTKLPKAHSTFGLYHEGNRVFVFTSDNELFILDEMGEITATSHETFRTYFISDGILYGEEFSAIRAVDYSSKNEIWRLDIEKSFQEAPIFDSGTIFLRTRFIPNCIYSIDQFTGKINWEVSNQDVLSNLYVTNEKIYFLSYGSELVSLDRISGEELSRDKFSPPFDLDEQSGGYFIAGDPANNILAIAFGDNTQVMGLRILEP